MTVLALLWALFTGCVTTVGAGVVDDAPLELVEKHATLVRHLALRLLRVHLLV